MSGSKAVFTLKTLAPAGLALIGMAVLVSGCAGLTGGSSGGVPGVLTNAISVTGRGQSSGTPDIAHIDLGVDVRDQDAGAAISEANRIITRVQEAVQEAGVAVEDIQTTSLNVWPEDLYDRETGQPTGERVYHVQNILRLTVRDVTKAGDVIDAALGAGANNVQSLSFSIDDTSALEAEARARALEDAQERAQQLADGLGLNLGSAIVVTEVLSSGYPIVERAADAGGGGAGTPVSAGQLTVTIEVTVTFAIVP